MKKRFTALLVLIIVLITTAYTCVACSSGIFEKDGNRDYHQVIATVSYEGMAKDIYKGQLLTYVGSYGATYQQNYNMTLEEIVEYFYNSLTQNALMTLYAKSYIYGAAKDSTNKTHEAYNYIDTKKSLAELNKNPSQFLTLPEYVYSIDTANNELFTSFNALYEELYNEKVTEEEDEEEEESEEELAARTVRSYTDSTTSSFDKNSKAPSVAVVYGPKYINLTYKDITEKFITDELKTTKEDFIKSISFVSQIDKKIAKETNTDKKTSMKSAKKKLLDNIEKNYMTIEKFVDIQIDATILQSYRTSVKDYQAKLDEEVLKLYNKNKKSAIETYLDEETYASALSSSTFTLANASQDYVGVKSILLKFSDKQSSALTAIKSMYANSPTKVAQLRDAMALGVADPEGLIETLCKGNKGIEVNVSNPFYNAEEDKLASAYTDKGVAFSTVIAAMADNIAIVTDEIVAKYKESINYDALSAEEKAEYATKIAIVEQNARVEAFTQWIYLVNDDDGMFSNDSYQITPDGADTTYVPEFTVLGRLLGQGNLGDSAIASYSTGTSTDITLEYTGTTDTISGVGDAAKLYTLANQVSTTKTGEDLKANIYTIETAKGNKISFIVNDYGIHIIMITKKFGCSNYVSNGIQTVDEKGEPTDDPTKIKGYLYTLDSIFEEGCTIKYDYTYSIAETYVENTDYYVWKAGEFEKVEITEFKTGVEYYTRVWELQSVKVKEKTYRQSLEETLTSNTSADELTVNQIKILFNEVDDTLTNKYIIKNTKVYDKFLDEIGVEKE